MKIHDIVKKIYECLKACVDTIALIKFVRFQQMKQITYEVCIFFSKNVSVSIRNLLKFVPKKLNDNKPALVRVKAWY